MTQRQEKWVDGQRWMKRGSNGGGAGTVGSMRWGTTEDVEEVTSLRTAGRDGVRSSGELNAGK